MLSQDEVLKRVAGLSVVELTTWISQGWVLPARQADAYVFRDIDVARVRLIYELRTDLSIGDEALPAILSLLDQVYGLRRELRALAEAVEQEDDDVRQRIISEVERRRAHPLAGKK